MVRDRLSVAAALALLLMTGSARAQTQMSDSDDRISAGIIAHELQDLGYAAKVDADDSGDPRVNTAVDGHKWQVYFYDCTGGQLEDRRCQSFQFFADNSMDKPVPVALINQWNKEYRYAKAYLQQGNEPGCPQQRSCAARIEIDVLTAGTGADPAHTFRVYFEVMRRRAAGFRKYISAPD